MFFKLLEKNIYLHKDKYLVHLKKQFHKMFYLEEKQYLDKIILCCSLNQTTYILRFRKSKNDNR